MKINTSEWEEQNTNEPTKIVARVPKLINIIINRSTRTPFLIRK